METNTNSKITTLYPPSLIAKKININADLEETEQQFRQRVETEYMSTAPIKHLNPERPIFNTNIFAYILMRKIPGIELFYIINQFSKKNDIPVRLVLDLTIAEQKNNNNIRRNQIPYG